MKTIDHLKHVNHITVPRRESFHDTGKRANAGRKWSCRRQQRRDERVFASAIQTYAIPGSGLWECVSLCVLKRGDLHAYVGGPLPPRVTDSSSTRYSHRATRGIVERFGKLLASQHTRKAMVFSLSLCLLPPRCLLCAPDDCIREICVLLSHVDCIF